jgi:hypothetical protein
MAVNRVGRSFFRLACCAAVLSGSLYAEPLLVTPVQAPGLDAPLRERVGLVLETALVDSGAYEVTSPADTELLLEAQSMYASGAFDESGLPALGAFLPARIAVLSRIEGGAAMLLQLKIVEISSGKILRAAAAALPAGPSGAGTDAAVRKAAFALVGADDPVLGPSGAIELVIDADVRHAEVYVDRRLRGTSPCSVGGLEPGEHLVELKKGAYYAARKVDASSSAKLDFILGMRYGSLIIKAEPENPEVTVGGVYYNVRSIIEKLPAERQSLFLRKPGWYWRGEVPVRPDASTMVNVRLLPTASLDLRADAKTLVTISGQGIVKSAMASVLLTDLLPGAYRLDFKRQNRESYAVDVELASGEEKTLEPEFEEKTGLEGERTAIRAEIERLGALRAGIGLDPAFEARPVPDLGTQATGDFFLSFIPLVNLTLFSQAGNPPAAMAPSIRARRVAQFALGSLCGCSVIALLSLPYAEDSGAWGAVAMSAAAASAGLDLGISMYEGIRLGRWRRAQEEKKKAFDSIGADLSRQLAALQATME